MGKSTVSANLALALAAEGDNVGLMDADIYGPSQGLMMGVPTATKPKIIGNLLQPVMAHDVQIMSMGFVANERTPAVWRGPMASGALQQLLTQTHWQDVDYLVVDMPPGTGDIQLTMAQQVPINGAVIVTTPQDIALLDARKGIEMFRKVEVPILGIVENMSLHTCTQCGHQEAVFGSGGGAAIAREYETSVLGRLPLSMAVRQEADSGKPTVVSAPDAEVSLIFRQMARLIKQVLAAQQLTAPKISVRDD